MINQIKLNSYIKNLSINARKLQENLDKISPLMPINGEKIASLQLPESSYLEVVHSRFCKMQDDLGTKVFPSILQILNVPAETFIDKLNCLEKYGYIDDAHWWMKARELRNEVTHDYEDDYHCVADHANQVFEESKKILFIWAQLLPKLEALALKAA